MTIILRGELVRRTRGKENLDTMAAGPNPASNTCPARRSRSLRINQNNLVSQFLFFTLLLFSTIEYCSGGESRVVCYYTNWSAYRQGPAKFLPDNINPYLCTHLIYAFGGLTSDAGIKPFDKYQDIDKGGYTKFNGLKTYNKALKTLIAIGGWNEGSRRFSALVADPEARKSFIRHSIRFLRQHHFDGLDLDWEYPAAREGGEDQDKPNYAQFIKELREAFEDESRSTGRPRLLLTIAVPAGIDTIEKGFDIPSINRDVDFFNILTYDYHASTEPTANHHAPLKVSGGYSAYDYTSQLNIEYTIEYYLKEGADSDKLVVGIPTYGRSYTLFNVESTDVGAPASGPGTKGKFTKEAGYLAYYEICEGVKSGQWRVENENNDNQGPHAINGDQWVGYDDTRIAEVKAKWVREMNLGGIMFWSVDNDDFRGSCHGKPFPLIEAAKQAYYTNENAAVSSSRPNSRFPTKSKSSNRLSSSRFTTPSPPSTTTGTQSRRKKKPKKTNKRRPKPRTTARTTTTASTTTSTTPANYNPLSTPAPPTTPDPGVDFECKDEGFFPHPRECKKYFWCLDAPGLGLVAHHFTCPAGLFFNKLADSCDYARNVPCKPGGTTVTTTTTTTPKPTTTTTTQAPDEDEYYDEEEESEEEDQPQQIARPKTTFSSNSGKSAKEIDDIKDLLRIIKKLGGVEELEKYLDDNPSAAKAVQEVKTEAGDDEEDKPATKKPLTPSRFAPSPSLNRNRFKPSQTSQSNSSPVVINPLRYTSIQRTKPPTPTKKAKEEDTEEEEEEEEEEEDSKEEDFRPPSRAKPKEAKEYVTLNRDKKTSSTETSVVVRISDDEKLLENDANKGTTEKPVTFSRSYAKVTGESQVQETVNTNRLRYVSLSRNRPSTSTASSRKVETEVRRGSDANNGAEEVDDDDKASPSKSDTEEEATEEEEVERPKPSSSTTTFPKFSTTPSNSEVSTAKPIRIRIPTRKTLGFSRSRNTLSTTSSSRQTIPIITTTPRPDENASSRRSRAFSVGNRRNLLAERAERRRTSTTTTSTTPSPSEEEKEEEASDESPAESIDDYTTNPAYPSSSTRSTSTSTTSVATTATRSPSDFRRNRGRQRQNEIPVTSTPARPRQRQRQRTTTSTTEPYYQVSSPVTELEDVYRPFQRIRRPISTSTATTLTPLTGSPNFQTAIVRRRTRKPTVLSTSTTSAPFIRRTTSTTTPVPYSSTRYAPNIATSTVGVGSDDGTEYYYYYYDDADDATDSVYKKSQDDLFDKSQSVRAQFSKRNLDLRPATSNLNANSNANRKKASSATVPLSEKIRLDEAGNIFCLDKGIFPHPKSCKKFVHCVDGDEEIGGEKGLIRGWIYSCPELLTFDVVGGMCNWAPNGTSRNERSSCVD